MPSPNNQPQSLDHHATPQSLGYTMPAEWEPHFGTWLTWPWEGGDSFRGKCPEVFIVYRELVAHLARVEKVFINVWDEPMIRQAEDALQLSQDLRANVSFYQHPAHEPWARDHGPIFLKQKQTGNKAIVDWEYNAWGGKYPPFDRDNEVPRKIATLRDLPRFEPRMVLEGGSIEVNGKGLLMTTESCLTHPNRNPTLSKSQIEERLREFFGITHILWLGEGIVGDDTDGHIDDMTRFVNENTIVTALEADPNDANYRPLKENRNRLETFNRQHNHAYRIVELPMPSPVIQEGIRLPASYANFYIANQRVIVPTFQDANDTVALETIQALFPDREVIGLDSTTLIWGLGSFHCMTQQEPLGPDAPPTDRQS